jgi:hypothetical protein
MVFLFLWYQLSGIAFDAEHERVVERAKARESSENNMGKDTPRLVKTEAFKHPQWRIRSSLELHRD